MPHQCTNCGRQFADGSKEMLSGCPDCGGNKFQFAPTATAATDSSASTETETDGSGAVDAGSTPNSSATEPPDGVATRAAETVRNLMSSDSADDAESDGTDHRQPTDAGPTADADSTADAGSWPSSGTAGTDDSEPATGTDTGPEGEFDEWPETARRPADRSDPPADRAVDDTERSDRSANGSNRPTEGPTTTYADDENTAQADARSEVVPPDELPAHEGDEPRLEAEGGDKLHPGTDSTDESLSATDSTDESLSATDSTGGTQPVTDTIDEPPEHGRVVQEPSGQRPSIEELRAELNEQFESIKIVRPGQYELNLMELYNREEYIISLQEDGRYVIDVPDSWRDADDE
ncbi:hypothetical protein A6E15_16045 [Natrinema saccharevitans]|uniref:Zn-ribbon containing protein n=1 Tax=Natrinema saccharevitans TaxID=301967 RepID=A0A1S8B057_9EURY|nr:Zn-ribbon containing protein [Natrinema saccharevitans]OLZ42385.1 hypothetical protein A6E15_16045 [Natrinema saccharevitans]